MWSFIDAVGPLGSTWIAQEEHYRLFLLIFWIVLQVHAHGGNLSILLDDAAFLRFNASVSPRCTFLWLRRVQVPKPPSLWSGIARSPASVLFLRQVAILVSTYLHRNRQGQVTVQKFPQILKSQIFSYRAHCFSLHSSKKLVRNDFKKSYFQLSWTLFRCWRPPTWKYQIVSILSNANFWQMEAKA